MNFIKRSTGNFVISLTFLFALSIAADAAQVTVTVADDNNDGLCNAVCTLREAIQAAGPSDEVIFSPLFNTPQTIDLTGGHMTTNGITITGPGAHLLTVRSVIGQGPISRIFNFNGSINLSGMTITGGNVNGAGGGGIAIGSGTAVLTGVVVTGNTAAGGVTAFSGGITMSGGLLIMNNCTVSNNTVSSPFEDTGGGIRVMSGELQMNNSTVSGNRSTLGNFNGGGIFLHGPGTITNSTITDNETVGTQRASGLYNAGFSDIVMHNTIVAGNRNNAAHPDTTGQFDATSSYNLIGNVGTATGFTLANNNQLGNGGAQIDPLLAALGNYGGSTPTHSPNIGSPAVDKGICTACTLDQRGLTRPVDLAVANAPGGDGSDIGSFEAQVTTAASVYIGGQVLAANLRPVANAEVLMTDHAGNTRSARTSPFGYFVFDDVAAGGTYFFSVVHKRSQFQMQAVTVTGEMTDLNFIAVN
jgi:CSLREA domain-containing protein